MSSCNSCHRPKFSQWFLVAHRGSKAVSLCGLMCSFLLQGHPGRISSLVLNIGAQLLPSCAILVCGEITELCPDYSPVVPQVTVCTGNAPCNWPLGRGAVSLPAVRQQLHRAIKAGVGAGSK